MRGGKEDKSLEERKDNIFSSFKEGKKERLSGEMDRQK